MKAVKDTLILIMKLGKDLQLVVKSLQQLRISNNNGRLGSAFVQLSDSQVRVCSDDDDFEPDVKQLDEKKGSIIEEVEEAAPEEHIVHTSIMMCKCGKVMNMFEQVPKPQPSKPKPKSKAKSPLGSFAADLGRELTAKEREEIQMKSDLGFAKDLFGTNGDGPTSYSEITTIEEFRMFGEEVGQMLATRANATHYVEMVTVLLKVALEKCLIYMGSRRLRTITRDTLIYSSVLSLFLPLWGIFWTITLWAE
uniref:Uncharacterized protein n=1 Tax=Parascaris equorum TaxID=6256 RepID=A0A914S0M6_PAREQ